AEKVRPLTDNLSVLNATKIDIKVVATLELTDMLFQDEIAKAISALPTTLSLGEDLNLSYIYKNLHQNDVYRVSLKEPLNDKKISVKEFVNLSYEISYKKAEL
ncbi:MAG: baseplate J/gp47 family protein, partial [Campylobacter concisus]|nr:baseplate J/gp47 family protein [Campylobacter concisus]